MKNYIEIQSKIEPEGIYSLYEHSNHGENRPYLLVLNGEPVMDTMDCLYDAIKEYRDNE